MARIWTSRFSNRELASGKYTVVGIVRGLPKFPLKYPLAGNIKEIAPSYWTFRLENKEEYRKSYIRDLDRVGIRKIYELLNQYLALGKDVVLCCYEDVRDETQWCHRVMFAEWWLKHTGEVIEELYNPTPLRVRKPKPEPKFEETSLF